MKIKRFLAPVFCAVLLVSGCGKSSVSAGEESQNRTIYAMDTVMTLTAYGPHASQGLEEAAREIQHLDTLLSISSESGNIYGLNREGERELSSDTAELLRRALELSEETGGLFDCTIQPVMEAWGFPTKNYRVPSEETLSRLLEKVDFRQVVLEGNHASLPGGVRLDLGGIGKGFASSRVTELLRETGVTSAILSLGGNVQTLGHRPDGKLWRVGIQDPDQPDDIFAFLETADEAVITSGAYQRYFEENGIIYHHIIDPRTGYPADSGLTSVTIVSSDGTLADAFSTALFIMGAEEASDFWRQHREEFEAILLTDDGQVLITDGLADRCTVTGERKVQVIS